jgi:nicotinamidase-related amidase
MSGKAVLVIDMLNDFVKGSMKNKRASKIVSPLEKLLQAARAKGIPVIYCNDAHLKGIDRELLIWGEHALAGTEGAEVIAELKPLPGDYVFPKRRYSGFFQTGLHLLLEELAIDTLIVTGLLVSICVRHTVADAYYWGYHIHIPRDAVEDLTEEAYQRGLDEMTRLYAAQLTSVEEIIKGFAA